jgi:DNA-binding transcriptional LysR family regulator
VSFTTAAHILAEGRAAENEVIAHSAVPRGHVRLAAPTSFGVLHIAPILPEFLALYPEVTIDLYLSDAHVDLVGDGYDAAISIASLPDSSLIARTLAPVSRYLVAAQSYLSKWGRPQHPLRLTEHRCIAYISTSDETWHFSNAKGETATVRPVATFRVNNGEAMLPALTAGIGLGILPDFILHEARLVGQHRLDRGPFIITEFVAHDSRLRFRSLNHVSGSAINPDGLWLVGNTLNLLPLL